MTDREFHLFAVNHAHDIVFDFGRRQAIRQLAADESGPQIGCFDNDFRLKQPGLIFERLRLHLSVDQEERDGEGVIRPVTYAYRFIV